MDFYQFAKEAELIKFPANMTLDEILGEELGFVIDPEYVDRVLKTNPKLVVYTLLDNNEIIPGFHLVNRQGYLFGKKQVDETILFTIRIKARISAVSASKTVHDVT